MNFWTGQGPALELPDPQAYSMNLPVEQDPTLTQSGFFIPLGAPDDVDCTVTMSWDALDSAALDALLDLRSPATFSFNDPLDLFLHGYFRSFDHQTVDGRVAEDGGPMYGVQVSVQVLSLRWPDVLAQFEPLQRYAPQTPFGISARGVQPAWFAGVKDTETDARGWALCSGGDTEPWGPVMPPTRDGEWDRSIRQRIAPVHGVQANYVALDAAQLPPVRGSVFLAFKPLPDSPL